MQKSFFLAINQFQHVLSNDMYYWSIFVKGVSHEKKNEMSKKMGVLPLDSNSEMLECIRLAVHLLFQKRSENIINRRGKSIFSYV